MTLAIGCWSLANLFFTGFVHVPSQIRPGLWLCFPPRKKTRSRTRTYLVSNKAGANGLATTLTITCRENIHRLFVKIALYTWGKIHNIFTRRLYCMWNIYCVCICLNFLFGGQTGHFSTHEYRAVIENIVLHSWRKRFSIQYYK